MQVDERVAQTCGNPWQVRHASRKDCAKRRELEATRARLADGRDKLGISDGRLGSSRRKPDAFLPEVDASRRTAGMSPSKPGVFRWKLGGFTVGLARAGSGLARELSRAFSAAQAFRGTERRLESSM